jgi:pyruvate,water dikinase
MGGQLDTFLNTKKEDLLLNVEKCFASLFTDRAIIYRINKKLIDKKISVAVIVQKMINSEKSGIAFSVHPVTNDYDQIIIDAGYGLGEAIVSGQITPIVILYLKNTRSLDKIKGSQEKALYRTTENQSGNFGKKKQKNKKTVCLTDKEIQVLSKILLNIEKHYGVPVM